jgi:hypothetical protein
MPIAVAYEDRVASLAGEARGEDLWVAGPELSRTLGWELKPDGLCRGALCVPVPPARRAAVVREDGAVNVAALARLRGQAVAHDEARTAWVFGASPDVRGATARSLVAPDFTLPDLDGRLHSLSDARGKKVVLASWASW